MIGSAHVTEKATQPRGRPPKRVPSDVDKRELLLQAAGDEFREVGYFSTNSNKIAVRAGLAPGTFYNYFKDKVEVFLEVYEQWIKAEWEKLGKIIAAGPVDQQMAAELANIVIRHHEEWTKLRVALEVLTGQEQSVRALRTRKKAEQIDTLCHLVFESTGRPADQELRTRIAVMLLHFEKVVDCIASGEADLLALSREQMIEGLVLEIAEFAHAIENPG